MYMTLSSISKSTVFLYQIIASKENKTVLRNLALDNILQGFQ